MKTTEARASVGFPALTPPNSKYIPRECLFRHEAIVLHGRWSEESAGIAWHKPRSRDTTM